MCGAHQLSELTYEFERNGQPWAQQEMILTLGGVFKACNAARAHGATAQPVAENETFTARYRAAVQAGQTLNPAAARIEGWRGRTKQPSSFNLLKRCKTMNGKRCTLCTISLCLSSTRTQRKPSTRGGGYLA